jgi:hypothetical protein
MARESVAWKVYYNKHGQKSLYVASCPVTVTAKQVTLKDPRASEFDFKVIMSLDELDETREAALERFDGNLRRRLAQLREEADELSAILAMEVGEGIPLRGIPLRGIP